MQRFLLDTGVLLGIARQAPWAEAAHERFGLDGEGVVSLTSVVCVGELMAVAEKRGWGAKSRERMNSLLARIPSITTMAPDLLDAYARIDAWTCGKTVVAPGGAVPPKPALPMGKNDPWIAATAHVTATVLLSTDMDFERLRGIWVKYEWVDQSWRPTAPRQGELLGDAG